MTRGPGADPRLRHVRAHAGDQPLTWADAREGAGGIPGGGARGSAWTTPPGRPLSPPPDRLAGPG
ncbi:MAG: hypothetical protein IPH03_06180 [Tetrasphaera sp.]|nr:hypothetical protein [Tetrasphaera sp.]